MKTIPFFRAGKHVDSRGRTVEFTEKDLAASISGYDPALHRAPLVIGHPKDNGPAYGWVRSISRNLKGEATAVPEQVHNDFAEGVAAGTWYPRSASWYAPTDPRNPKPGIYYLRHIGFLGAQPPAIKGLSDIEFDDGEGVLEIEFGDFGDAVAASIFRRLRDWFIDQFGQETADKVVPGWDVDNLLAESRREDDRPSFTEPTPPSKPTTEEHTVSPTEQAALEAENKRLKADIAKRDKADLTAAQDAIHASNVEYAEKLVAAGMKPVHAPAVIAALDYAESSETPLEFGEDDAREPLIDGLKAIFSNLAGGVSFAEVATKGRAGKTVTQPTNPLLADAEARSQR
ncbi:MULTISPECIES: peptidase [Pseudomonas]|uniref:peptidase n=1 Tax=Pseudomonas TaxID=286 RepID=UPI000B352E14|nr:MULTISPECIES: peptidase [Pseudomonas]PMY62087.1 peptidase [Pseudomonas sp. FW305-25]PMY63712.1 peptidase [Pseudomonas sp. FW126-L8]PNA76532.1 peptidase [Pseudomonas sp. FW305-76]